MRAWRAHAHGRPSEVLRLDDVTMPVPGPDQVRIAVEHAALNLPDVRLCEGSYAMKPALPFTPGLEAAGRLDDGERVVAVCALPHGSLAEQALADAHNVYPVPDAMPLADAASMLIAYQTAIVGLWRRAQLRSRDVLLVHGGSGGVGLAAIQLGAALGCRVIAVAGGPDKTTRCLAAGATDVIDHRSLGGDFTEAVLSLTDGRGADVVFDPVGGEVLERSLRCVAVDARVLIVGFAGGDIASVATNKLLYKSCSLMGVYVGAYSRDDVGRAYLHDVWDDIVGLYDRGAIRPAIDLVVSFAEAPAALDALADRRATGKVIVDVLR